MLALLRFIPSRIYAAAGVLAVLAAGWFYVSGLRSDLRAADVQAQALTARAAAAEEALRTERARAAVDAAAVASELEAERARADHAQDLLARIDRAPAEDDGPLAAVLRQTLEALK